MECLKYFYVFSGMHHNMSLKNLILTLAILLYLVSTARVFETNFLNTKYLVEDSPSNTFYLAKKH